MILQDWFYCMWWSFFPLPTNTSLHYLLSLELSEKKTATISSCKELLNPVPFSQVSPCKIIEQATFWWTLLFPGDLTTVAPSFYIFNRISNIPGYSISLTSPRFNHIFRHSIFPTLKSTIYLLQRKQLCWGTDSRFLSSYITHF